ncbi:MAG: hypothetical protein KDE56_32710, partial [Anaerolineales bacterium]|nr:hypothetical protein [Anaerolineales bacterium]
NLNPVISGVSNAGPVNEGGSVTVSVTASDADNLRYEFDCDGDGEYEVGPQTSSSTNCAVGGSNTQINVRVTDGEGGDRLNHGDGQQPEPGYQQRQQQWPGCGR